MEGKANGTSFTGWKSVRGPAICREREPWLAWVPLMHFPVRWVRVGALRGTKPGVRKLLYGVVDAPGATVRRTEATMRATRRGSAKALGNAAWDWNQCLVVDLRLRCIHQRIRDPDEMVSSDPS